MKHQMFQVELVHASCALYVVRKNEYACVYGAGITRAGVTVIDQRFKRAEEFHVGEAAEKDKT
jgi:hypothetical protein